MGSYHRGEFIEPKGTLWAPQNVLVQKILLFEVTVNGIKSLRYSTLLIRMFVYYYMHVSGATRNRLQYHLIDFQLIYFVYWPLERHHCVLL